MQPSVRYLINLHLQPHEKVCVAVKGVITGLLPTHAKLKNSLTLNITCVQEITCLEAVVREGGKGEGREKG